MNLNFQYAAAANDSFTPLTGSSVSGTFATVNAMSLDPSLQVATAYDPGDVTFTLVPSMDVRSPGLSASSAEATNSEVANAFSGNRAGFAPAATAQSLTSPARLDCYFGVLATAMRDRSAEDLPCAEV